MPVDYDVVSMAQSQQPFGSSVITSTSLLVPPFMTYNVNRNCIASWAFEYLISPNFACLMLKETVKAKNMLAWLRSDHCS